MAQAKNGDRVKVHYTGKLEDGEVFDSSEDRRPIEFTIGEGEVISGFEKGIVGMETGEKKTLEVPPEDGYGPRREELVANVNKNEFPNDITPAVGQQLKVRQPDGGTVNVVVSSIDQENVTLDANHPLAGRTLKFDVELVDVS